MRPVMAAVATDKSHLAGAPARAARHGGPVDAHDGQEPLSRRPRRLWVSFFFWKGQAPNMIGEGGVCSGITKKYQLLFQALTEPWASIVDG